MMAGVSGSAVDISSSESSSSVLTVILSSMHCLVSASRGCRLMEHLQVDDLEGRHAGFQVENPDGSQSPLTGDASRPFRVGRAPGIDEEDAAGKKGRGTVRPAIGDHVDGAPE